MIHMPALEIYWRQQQIDIYSSNLQSDRNELW